MTVSGDLDLVEPWEKVVEREFQTGAEQARQNLARLKAGADAKYETGWFSLKELSDEIIIFKEISST